MKKDEEIYCIFEDAKYPYNMNMELFLVVSKNMEHLNTFMKTIYGSNRLERIMTKKTLIWFLNKEINLIENTVILKKNKYIINIKKYIENLVKELHESNSICTQTSFKPNPDDEGDCIEVFYLNSMMERLEFIKNGMLSYN